MRIKLTATSVAASNKIKWKRLEYLTQVFFYFFSDRLKGVCMPIVGNLQ